MIEKVDNLAVIDALIGAHDNRKVIVAAVFLLRLLDERLLLDGLVLKVQGTVLLERDEIRHVHLRLSTGRLWHIDVDRLEVDHVERADHEKYEQEEHDVDHRDDHDFRLREAPSVA